MMTMRHAVETSALILTIAGSVLAAPSPSFAGEQARSVNDPVEATPERLATSTFPMGVVTTDITKTEQQGSQRHITITADVLFDFDSVEVNPEFAAKGYGETEPVAENEKNGEDNPEGRAQNRRVEITYN